MRSPRLHAPASIGLCASLLLALGGCNTGPRDSHADGSAAPAAKPAATSPKPAATTEGALRLGAPIEASTPQVALTEVARNPSAFTGKTFATSGTVTAVCEHMGCWMEIKDDSGEAHIKMAGHAFFVPKTASGHKARVLATLASSPSDSACAEEGDDKMGALGGGAAKKGANPGAKTGCRAEAEAQLGRPLAKLELVADGIELM